MARPLWALALLLAIGCTTGHMIPDDAAADASARDASADSGRDAGRDSGVPLTCDCAPGLHNARIFVLSDEAELYSYDPLDHSFEYVLGPVCATSEHAYSMAVDRAGRAWIQYAETRRILTIDVNALAACEDSEYLPTAPEFPLFGMAFVRGEDGCSELYAHSYDGEGAFSEGTDLGYLGRVSGDPPRMSVLAPIDFDGGELAGTGDGRLFAFAGVNPAKLVEYDADDGSVIEIHPLDGFSKTNASAVAFFAGDFYLFTEALPENCLACLQASCPVAYAECREDVVCDAELSCAVERGEPTDDCGGGLPNEMYECLNGCGNACFVSPGNRLSQVTRLDWDESDGTGRALTIEVEQAPIRIVGAGTSPCVPTLPF
jgi:hypothetical protein